MRWILVIETIGYFGVLGLEIYWQAHGVRNEKRFALLQVATLSLLMLTEALFSYSPGFPFGLVVLLISVFVFWIVGYAVARWLYRKLFPPK